MRRSVDWDLGIVTGRGWAGGRSLPEIGLAGVAGGASVVQLREKDIPTRAFVDLAKHLKAFLAGSGVPLIVNDRVDVALAADADGVHVGQDDMEVADVRRLIGPNRILGLSVETLDQARAAEDWDVDYYGVSPIFATPTKTDTRGAWGVDGLRALRARTERPLVAIGGLHVGNAAEVVAAGADGVAVVSEICAAGDPQAAAVGLRRVVDAALAARS